MLIYFFLKSRVDFALTKYAYHFKLFKSFKTVCRRLSYFNSVQYRFFPGGFLISKIFILNAFLMDLLKEITGWNHLILKEMGHFHNLFPEGSGNIISLHKSLWKCHSHNKGFLMQKYRFIPARDFSFILCKYLHFNCFVENLRLSLRKIYGHDLRRKSL